MKNKDIKTVYIKLTNACQLKCQHCYNTICNSNDRMSEAVLNSVQHRIENLIKSGHKVMATFHGGEPMMYGGEEEFKKVNNFIDYFLENYPDDISFSMTTNLVYPLQPWHLELFNKFEKNDEGQPIISTSWDYKIRFSKREQLDLWYCNLELLIEKGFDVRPIITVTRALIKDWSAVETVSIEAFGIKSMNFERITCTGRAEENKNALIPTNKEMREWLFKVFLRCEEKGIKVPLFELIKDSVKYGKLDGCRARKCTQNVITFNPDGSIATCPNVADRVVGHVSPITTSDVKTEDFELAELIREEKSREEACLACDWYRYCNGDCFQLKHDETGCPGLPEIIKYVKENY